MTNAKKPVAVRHDNHGNITHVILEGNKTATPLDTAVRMAEAGKIEGVHAVHTAHGAHIRGNPDGKASNNLENLPEG